jgi:protein gp37
MKTHKIQWLNLPGYKGETWNPVIGCSKVSEGCKNCYAEKMANRLAHNPNTKADYAEVITVGKWNGKTTFTTDGLFKPENWRSPRVVFVCSMGDLFHETVRFEAIRLIFQEMSRHRQHIFIVLTKRPERMVEFYDWKKSEHGISWQPSQNIWMGVTAENQEQAINRIPFLNFFSASVKFVSIEPMLEEIHLNEALGSTLKWHGGGLKNCLSWVICGGESSHNARPMHPDWVRRLRDDCMYANVPFFFKQWGEWMPQGTMKNYNFLNPKKEIVAGTDVLVKVGKHKSGNLLDGEQHQQYPEIETRRITPTLKGDAPQPETSSIKN